MAEYAFPVSTIDNHTEFGITIRDYFAAKAMVAWCSESNFDGNTDTDINYRQLIAESCYKMADEMIIAREKS